MAFRSTLRLEEIYFNNLRRLIDTLKNWKTGDNSEEITDILDSCIESNSAILLLYKNLGEEWNELTAIIKETEKKLEELRESVTSYHDELNEKIDSVNNILNASIQSLETDIAGLEQRVSDLENAQPLSYVEFDSEDDPITFTKSDGTSISNSDLLDVAFDDPSVTLIDMSGLVYRVVTKVTAFGERTMLFGANELIEGATNYFIRHEVEISGDDVFYHEYEVR